MSRIILLITMVTSLSAFSQTNCSTLINPDYLETFDTFLPDCWEEADDGEIIGGPTNFNSSEWTAEEFAHNFTTGLGAVNININGLGINDWLLSPILDLSQGGYELLVEVALTNTDTTGENLMDSDDEVVLLYTTDNLNWQILNIWNVNNQPSEFGETYENELINLNGEPQVRFAFYATTGSSDGGRDYDFHIDNFSIATPSSCFDISNLVVTNVTSTTATINFDSNNDNSNGTFQYAVTSRLQGFPSSPTADLVDSSLPAQEPNATFVIGDGAATGPALQPRTAYDLYVREQCAPGIFSDWTIPVVFSTLCDDAAISFPLEINFANHLPDNCWTESGSGTLSNGPQTTGTSQWRGGRGYTDTTGQVIPSNAVQLDLAENKEWLISPVYDLTGGASEFLFVEVAVTSWQRNGASIASQTSNMGVDDQVYLVVSEDGGNNWVVLDNWNQNNRPLSTGSLNTYDISNYDSTTQFAMYATDGDIDDVGSNYDFHIGKFTISATASVPSESLRNKVNLYPNPVASGPLTLKTQNITEPINIKIYSASGKRIYESQYDNNEFIELMDVDKLSDGLYFIAISSGNDSTSLKFIKE